MYDVANKGFHEQSLKLNRVVQFDSLSGVAANDCSKTMFFEFHGSCSLVLLVVMCVSQSRFLARLRKSQSSSLFACF